MHKERCHYMLEELKDSARVPVPIFITLIVLTEAETGGHELRSFQISWSRTYQRTNNKWMPTRSFVIWNLPSVRKGISCDIRTI